MFVEDAIKTRSRSGSTPSPDRLKDLIRNAVNAYFEDSKSKSTEYLEDYVGEASSNMLAWLWGTQRYKSDKRKNALTLIESAHKCNTYEDIILVLGEFFQSSTDNSNNSFIAYLLQRLKSDLNIANTLFLSIEAIYYTDNICPIIIRLESSKNYQDSACQKERERIMALWVNCAEKIQANKLVINDETDEKEGFCIIERKL